MNDNSNFVERIFRKAHEFGKGGNDTVYALHKGIYLENDPVYFRNFIESAKKISGAHKIWYDEPTLSLVDKTAHIDVEEILGNLNKVSFRYDRLWIEGPSTNGKFRDGYLVETDSENHSFRFHRFITPTRAEVVRVDIHKFAREPDFVVADKVTVTVDRDGIHFDEDGLIEQLEKIQASLFRAAKHNRASFNQSVAKTLTEILPEEINMHFERADFLARLFVLMGADKNPPAPTDPRLLKQEEEKNRRLRTIGVPMKALSKPQLINLSLGHFGKSEPTAKTIRVLLGWTDVSRSKPIVSKYGIVFTRKPHERRIAAPEDRRGHRRDLTASNTDMKLAFGPLRPQLEPNSSEPII